jgi:hypothetical protein
MVKLASRNSATRVQLRSTTCNNPSNSAWLSPARRNHIADRQLARGSTRCRPGHGMPLAAMRCNLRVSLPPATASVCAGTRFCWLRFYLFTKSSCQFRTYTQSQGLKKPSYIHPFLQFSINDIRRGSVSPYRHLKPRLGHSMEAFAGHWNLIRAFHFEYPFHQYGAYGMRLLSTRFKFQWPALHL